MGHDPVERKLAAILHADVVGYSRLMGEDEVGTLRELVTSLDAITAMIESHGGAVVNFAGDAVLAEFTSAVNALTCAVDIQRDLKVQNESLPEERKLRFRIGLNVGDVIVSRNDIFGDGVNVAARLEGLADADGICISGSVLDQVKNKLELGYEYLGEQKVKNIADPVRAYRVIPEPETARMVVGEQRVRRGRWHWTALSMVILAIVGVGTIAIWNHYLRPTEMEIAAKKTSELKLSAKASIVVLPFKNIGGGLKQDYFSDGITEDIITDLSKFRNLFVIASSTAFSYKGKPIKVHDISEKLGVRYVLEGSVQRVGEKLRVNVQLIDGTTEHHLWAKRLVHDMKDLFALQDAIVRTIVVTLAIKVDVAERERAMRKGTDSLEAYDYVLRGREHRARTHRSANIQARVLFRRAIALDSRYAAGYVGLGWCYFDALLYGWTASPSETLQHAHDFAQKALRLDEESADAHRLLGSAYLKWKRYDLATSEFKRALELNPNDADTFDVLGEARLYTGQPDGAIEAIETAQRFNPSLSPNGLINLGLAYYLKGNYAKAIRTIERALGRNPNLVILNVVISAAYARAGRAKDAARAAANVRRLHPFFQVELFGGGFRKPADRRSIREGLREAGLN